MQLNIAAAFLTKNFKIIWGGAVPPLDAFVNMSLLKTNPLSKILDPPLLHLLNSDSGTLTL